MRAVQITGPDQMELAELSAPEPGPDEVLVAVARAGVCHTDIEVLSGTHGAYASGWAQYPVVPGHEWSGVVREVGSEVGGFAPGDLVTGETGIGCMKCRLCLAGAHNCCPHVRETGIINRDGAMRQLHTHPAAFTYDLDGLTPDQGALVEPATVAVYACRRAGLREGEQVAVCGGGSIGQLCAQAAKALGARDVLLTSRSHAKLELARALGADATVNVSEDDVREIAGDITNGEGFDVVLECAGAAPALDDALQIAGPRGRIAAVGYAAAEPYGHSLAKVIGVELSIIGVRGSPGVWQETIALMREGKLIVEPLISEVYDLADFREAFGRARAGGANTLKVLLAP